MCKHPDVSNNLFSASIQLQKVRFVFIMWVYVMCTLSLLVCVKQSPPVWSLTNSCFHKKVETQTNTAYAVVGERDDPTYDVVGPPRFQHHTATSDL